jgi:hypothetical protein
MVAKNDRIFDEVVTACRAKHLRELMYFQKNLSHEIIAQFFATLYIEERGTQEGSIGLSRGGVMRSPLSNLVGSLVLGEMMQTTTRFTLHSILKQARCNSCAPATKEGVWEPLRIFSPFYAYLNHLFRRTMTPREGDSSNIPSYN